MNDELIQEITGEDGWITIQKMTFDMSSFKWRVLTTKKRTDGKTDSSVKFAVDSISSTHKHDTKVDYEGYGYTVDEALSNLYREFNK